MTGVQTCALPISSHNPKTRPRIQKHFPESKNTSQILGCVLDSRKCLDSGKCFVPRSHRTHLVLCAHDHKGDNDDDDAVDDENDDDHDINSQNLFFEFVWMLLGEN